MIRYGRSMFVAAVTTFQLLFARRGPVGLIKACGSICEALGVGFWLR